MDSQDAPAKRAPDPHRRPFLGHIGGFTPFFSTMARGAVTLPSGFSGARMETAAPGFQRSSLSGAKVTMGVWVPTTISFAPSLYLSFSTRAFDTLATSATVALVMVSSLPLRSQG